MKKTLLIVAALLSACASQGMNGPPRIPPGARMQHQSPDSRNATYCHGASCRVQVSVTASCVVSVDPYVFVMDRSYGALSVDWVLTAPSGVQAKFTNGGIAFKDVAGQQVFMPRVATDTSVRFANAGTSGIYPYGVQVAVNGQACPVLDPTGINDM